MRNDQDDDRNAAVSRPGEVVSLAEYVGKHGTLTPLPEFDIQSFAGWEPERPEDDERPPRSAKHVVSVSWSWSPAHSRSLTYWLCTDRKRSAWYLWEECWDEFENRKQFKMIAHGTPYCGVAAKDAAERLLLAIWKEEWNIYESPGRGAYITKPGLVDSAEIARLEELAFPV